MRLQKLLAFALLLVFAIPAKTGQTYVDIGLGHVKGSYETGIESSINSLRAELGYFGSEYFFNATTSYINLDTEGLSKESGIGDLYFGGGYTYRLQDEKLKIIPSLSLKIPTADENKNLGSGESDAGVFLDVYKDCGIMTCTAGMGYIFTGDPDGINYNNIAQLSLGGFTGFERSGITAYILYSSALLDEFGDPVKVGVDWFYLFSVETAFYINGIAGLNDAAPDFGLQTGLVKWF